jgi:hypothetical protein
MNTPVALIIFNRPNTTEKVFETIRQAKPPILLVIADGARSSKLGEAEKCEATRAIIDRVDWECDVRTNYSDVNLGCKKRVSSGLDWVFENVEEAIILEDDCLPSPSFFIFCEEMLQKYREDERIMIVSGCNLQMGNSRTTYSYYFGKCGNIWGWASWRRAWKYYDVNMTTWPDYKDNIVDSFFDSPREKKYFSAIYDKIYNNKIDTWDIQWGYAIWCQHGLSIVPDVNLISNIGFGEDSTHTKIDNGLSNLPYGILGKIKHPPFVIRNKQADDFFLKQITSRNVFLQVTYVLSKIANKLQNSDGSSS